MFLWLIWTTVRLYLIFTNDTVLPWRNFSAKSFFFFFFIFYWKFHCSEISPSLLFLSINLTFLIIHFNSVRISSNKETVWKPVTYVYCLVILFSKTCSLLFFIFLTYHIIQLVLFRKM